MASSSNIEMCNKDDAALEFASLTPADIRTTRAVQIVLDRIYDQKAGLAHHRKFVRHQAGRLAARRSPAFQPSPSDLDSAYTTEADQSADEEESLSAAPCYILRLDELGRLALPKLGFSFGTGDLNVSQVTAGVDLLLPPHDLDNQWTSTSSSSTSSFVYARQGYFAFDPKYGTLWLHACHKGIRVDDRPLAPRSKILLEARARLSIGPYRFIFEFKVAEEKPFQEAKARYLAQQYGDQTLHESTSVTPSTNDVRIYNWILHGVVGASPLSVIHAASNVRSGEVVAVKRLRLGGSSRAAKEELEIYQAILSDIQGQQYRRFVMQKHSVLENGRHNTLDTEVYVLLKPLARGDFSQFGSLGQWHAKSQEVKKALFVQTLLGLSTLHDRGWIHRDLKPANLGVVELGDQPYGVILDTAQATREKRGGHTPRLAHCGTIGYLAPELESPATAATYGKEVDIWSMGAVAYFLFVEGKLPWSTKYNMFVPERDAMDPSLSTFRSVRGALLRWPQESFEHLIAQMMEEDPRRRPTMPDILKHSALNEVRKAIDIELDRDKVPGQKRNQDALES